MKEQTKQNKCPISLNKKVGECYYNYIHGYKHQRKEGEKLCSHCWNFDKKVNNLKQ